MYPPPTQGFHKHVGVLPAPAPPPVLPVSSRLHQHRAPPYSAAGMQVVHSDGSVAWTTGLITCVCPCITFGQIAEIVDEGTTYCRARGASYGLLGLTGLACLYSCFYRGRLRAQYNLEEAPTHDCLVHFCCEACALCQEYRQLRNYGFGMAIGWQANMKRQPGGGVSFSVWSWHDKMRQFLLVTFHQPLCLLLYEYRPASRRLVIR